MAAAMAFAGLLAPTAWPSGLQVSPIGLRLSATTQADALWLTNTGADTIHAQVRMFRWTQANGKDVLESSRDLVVSPPMVAIAPGDRQLVRVIRQVAPASNDMETAYRVLVDEIPMDSRDKNGLTFVLRYSIPVFLAPTGDRAVKAALHASWEETSTGATLHIRNSGNGHAQIADVVWYGTGGDRATLLPGLAGYALPGASMSWNVPGDARHATGAVRARINGDASESTLVVGPGGH